MAGTVRERTAALWVGLSNGQKKPRLRGAGLRYERGVLANSNELQQHGADVRQYVAEALGEGVITQADTWDELRVNVREAVAAYFFDRPAPERLRLHLVRDEIIA